LGIKITSENLENIDMKCLPYLSLDPYVNTGYSDML